MCASTRGILCLFVHVSLEMQIVCYGLLLILWGCAPVEHRQTGLAVSTEDASKMATRDQKRGRISLGTWELVAGKPDIGIPGFVKNLFDVGHIYSMSISRVGEFDLSEFQRKELTSEIEKAKSDPQYNGRFFEGLYESDDASSGDTYHVIGGFWVLREQTSIRVIGMNIASIGSGGQSKTSKQSPQDLFLSEGFRSDDAWTTPDCNPVNEPIEQPTVDTIRHWAKLNTQSSHLLGIRIFEVIATGTTYKWGKNRGLAVSNEPTSNQSTLDFD